MDINKFVSKDKDLLEVRVIPNSSRTELKEENGKLKLYLKSVPEKNKANSELVKFFKKNLGLKIEIISGKRSRGKVLKIL